MANFINAEMAGKYILYYQCHLMANFIIFLKNYNLEIKRQKFLMFIEPWPTDIQLLLVNNSNPILILILALHPRCIIVFIAKFNIGEQEVRLADRRDIKPRWDAQCFGYASMELKVIEMAHIGCGAGCRVSGKSDKQKTTCCFIDQNAKSKV